MQNFSWHPKRIEWLNLKIKASANINFKSSLEIFKNYKDKPIASKDLKNENQKGFGKVFTLLVSLKSININQTNHVSQKRSQK
jgi:hypothetical protein